MIEGHGDDSYRYEREIELNFSSNIYSHADLGNLYAHLRGCLDSITSYPAPEAYTLEAELATRLKINKESVLVTNGATEAIYLIAHAYQGLHAQVLQPTFREYADACTMNGCKVSALYQLPSEREHYRLDEGVGMLWLCNPNNPTGNLLDKRYLETLVKANPQVLFVVDQSYEDFVLQPVFSAAEVVEYDNLLLLHSMTKRYCVPGLRLGYITAAPHLVHQLRTHKMPWSVNVLAIEAGHYLLQHDIQGLPKIDAYLREAQRLRNRLMATGVVDVWETSTHFMLAQLRYGKSSALKDWLANECGILIRDASNFEGLDGSFFRIAAQDPADNDRLVAAIEEWIRL